MLTDMYLEGSNIKSNDNIMRKKGIGKWFDYNFESSTICTKEFNTFVKDLKHHIKKNLPQATKLTKWSKGHFIASGFIEKNNKFVYFSIFDVRCGSRWFENVLIRTAKNDKDYTGGVNNFIHLADFENAVSCLLNR